MEDNEILTLFLERKEMAISELERRYGTRLKTLASRMVPEEDAEECVNDTYLAVWNSVPPNRPEYLFAYAAKICRNLALNKLERDKAAKRSAVVDGAVYYELSLMYYPQDLERAEDLLIQWCEQF